MARLLLARARRRAATAALPAVVAGALAFPAAAARDDLILVSRATGGAPADGSSAEPAVSATGRFVAFRSDADNLSTGDNNSFITVFVRDLQEGTTTLASSTFDNAAGANDNSTEPSISADGRYVAFQSDADNLSAEDNDNVRNVFVRDLVASTTTLVSRPRVRPGRGRPGRRPLRGPPGHPGRLVRARRPFAARPAAM